MKNRIGYIFITIIFMFLLSACETTYPQGEIKIDYNKELYVNSTMTIEISYPEIGGTIVEYWSNPIYTVIEGNSCISIDGHNISGVEEGAVVIEMSVFGMITDDARLQGYDDKEYIVEIEFNVTN